MFSDLMKKRSSLRFSVSKHALVDNLDQSAQSCAISGWLLKMRRKPGPFSSKLWDRRFFALEKPDNVNDPGALVYYTAQNKKDRRGLIDFTQVNNIQPFSASTLDESDTKIDFEDGYQWGFKLTCSERVWILTTNSEENQKAWLSAIYLATGWKVAKSDINQQTIHKSGWLSELNDAISNTWTDYFFALYDQEISYFNNETCETLINSISLNKIVEISQYTYENYNDPLLKNRFELVCASNKYIFSSKTESDTLDWIEKIAKIGDIHIQKFVVVELHSGWMYELITEDQDFENLKSYFFVLDEKNLTKYVDDSRNTEIGKISMNSIRNMINKYSKGNSSTKIKRFILASENKNWIFATDSIEKSNKWLEMFQFTTNLQIEQIKEESNSIPEIKKEEDDEKKQSEVKANESNQKEIQQKRLILKVHFPSFNLGSKRKLLDDKKKIEIEPKKLDEHLISLGISSDSTQNNDWLRSLQLVTANIQVEIKSDKKLPPPPDFPRFSVTLKNSQLIKIPIPTN